MPLKVEILAQGLHSSADRALTHRWHDGAAGGQAAESRATSSRQGDW